MVHTVDHKEDEKEPLFDNLYTPEEIKAMDVNPALQHHQTREGLATGTDVPPEEYFERTDIPSGKLEWTVFASKLGFADTLRGTKQLLGVDLENMKRDQQILNMGMNDPELRATVMGAYFAGLFTDPAGFAVPMAKAKNAMSALRWGAGFGTVSGFTGYVDPEAKSLVRAVLMGEDVPMSRIEQTLIGTAGGSALSPLMHLLGQKGGAVYAKFSPKLKRLVRVPEVGTSLVGAGLGSYWNEDEDWSGTVRGFIAGFALSHTTKYIKPGEGSVGRVGSRKWLGQMLIDNFGVPEGYVAYKHGRRMTKAEVAEEFNEIGDMISKLSPEENKAFYSMIQGEIPVSDALKPLHKQTRDLLEKHGRRLVDLGVLDEDVFLKNMDTYIHRTYRDHMTQYGVGSNPERIRVLGDELRIRGNQQLVQPKDVRHMTTQGYEVVKKMDDGQVLMTRQLTKAEREALNEIEDAQFALSRTGHLFSNDIATYKFFDDVANDAALSSPAVGIRNTDHTYQIPTDVLKDSAGDVLQYGNLAGRYVSEGVYNDLVNFTKWRHLGSDNKVVSGYLKALRAWKISKTALNPAVHANNFLSNVMLFDLKKGKFRYLKPAARALFEGSDSDLYKEARRAGLFDSDYAARELRDSERVAYSNYVGIAGGEDALPKTAFDLARNLALKSIKWGPNKLIDLYQAEDRVFRLALFKTLREQGMEPAEAARIARRDMIDYDIDAPGINFARQTGWPFLAYTYRVMPLLVDAAIDNPLKFAKWAALFYGLNELGELVGGELSEKEKAAMPKDFADSPMFGVKGMPTTMTRLPFTSGDVESVLTRIKQNLVLPIPDMPWTPESLRGREQEVAPVQSIGDFPLYFDWSRKIPGGDVFGVGQGFGPRAPFLTKPLQPSGGVFTALLMPLFGRDATTWEQAPGWNADENMGRHKAKAMVDLYLEAVLPNFPYLPGSYASGKISQAQRQTYSFGQRELPPWMAIGQTLGLTVKKGDIPSLGKQKSFELSQRMGGFEELLKDLYKQLQQGKISTEEFRETYRRLQLEAAEARREAYQKK